MRPAGAGTALRREAAEVPVAIGRAMGLTPAEFGQLKGTLRQLTDNVTAATR